MRLLAETKEINRTATIRNRSSYEVSTIFKCFLHYSRYNLFFSGEAVEYRPSSNFKESSNLQSHKDSVKFKSDLNLYAQSKDEIISQTPIIASTSSDSLSTTKKETKPKPKRSWKKLLLPVNSSKLDKEPSSNNNSNKSKYKKFFSRYSKKAVAS